MQQIQGSSQAFAAILVDGSVVTWGNPEFGADSTAVQYQLRISCVMCSSVEAFLPNSEKLLTIPWLPRAVGISLSHFAFLLTSQQRRACLKFISWSSLS